MLFAVFLVFGRYVLSSPSPSRPLSLLVLLSCPPTQGTAAGRGSAASVEFLEEAYKAANAVAPAGEQGRGESGGEPPTPENGKTRNTNSEEGEKEEGSFSDSEPAGKTSLEGGRTTTGSETEESNEEEVPTPDRRNSETAKDASGDNGDGGNSAGPKGRAARGRQGSGRDTGANAADLPGGISGGGRLVGFGVVGEEETVELALQALAKVCVVCCTACWFVWCGLSCCSAGREEDGCKHAISRAAEQQKAVSGRHKIVLTRRSRM